MKSVHYEDLGKLVLRLAIGGLLLFHGIDKVRHGVIGEGKIGAFLQARHLPEELAYGAYVGELVAPILIVVGFMTRIGGLLVAGNMTIAVYTAFGGRLGEIDAHGGWAPELPMLYLLGGLALLLLGGGKFALWQRGGPLG